MQASLFSIINKIKREELNKIAAIAIYYGGRPLSMLKDLWMNAFLLKGFGYKPPGKIRLSEDLLDKAYSRTKIAMTKILDNSSVLNIVVNKSDNQTGEKIINMCVLTQQHQSFHIISELASSMQLDACNKVV